MKIKSLLIGMLASTAFVACTNDESPVNNEQTVGGKAENYLAVNIAMPSDVTFRGAVEADDNGYFAGSTAETKVTDAVFLFFDEEFNGCAEPYYLNAEKAAGLSWVSSTETGVDKKATVLVIENNKQKLPTYVLAILNPTGGENHGFKADTKLSDLQDITATYSTDTDGFVMSNSVYVDANGQEVTATPIPVENIFSTSTEALANPITIPVERVVSKVYVSGLETGATNWTAGEKENPFVDGTSFENLSLKITGWEILQNKESYLVKNIAPADWTSFNWWNAPANKRSFWAVDYTDGGRTSYYVDEMNDFEPKYVEETVNQTFNDTASDDVSPYLLVRGYFVGEDGKTPEGLVEWRGVKYKEANYLNLIAANTSVSKYYYVKSTTKDAEGNDINDYESFLSSFLEMVDYTEDSEGTPVDNDWQGIAQLKADAPALYTCTFKADGKVDVATPANLDDVKAAIAAFGPVKYWDGGNTYFFTPIEHRPGATDKVYGVVRNHIYDVTISSITGFGTPVAEPKNAIDKPEKPVDDETYLAAKVNILKWKVVTQTTPLN